MSRRAPRPAFAPAAAPIAIRPLGATTATSATHVQPGAASAGALRRTRAGERPGQATGHSARRRLANPKVVVDSAGGATMYGTERRRADSVRRRLDAVRRPQRIGVSRHRSEGRRRARHVDAGRESAWRHISRTRRHTAIPGYSPTLGIVYRLPMPRPQIERPRQGEPGDHPTSSRTARWS